MELMHVDPQIATEWPVSMMSLHKEEVQAKPCCSWAEIMDVQDKPLCAGCRSALWGCWGSGVERDSHTAPLKEKEKDLKPP